jgi:hypothetical protein
MTHWNWPLLAALATVGLTGLIICVRVVGS